MFNMSAYADWQSGIVNRNYFILKSLLQHESVSKILAVDFLHHRKKRLLKDYYYGVLRPRDAGKAVFRSLMSKCQEISGDTKGKLFVYSTISHVLNPKTTYKELQKILKQLQMTENLIIWSYNPLEVGYFDNLVAERYVFDTVDNWLTHKSFKSHRVLLQSNYESIAKKSDVIFTVSPQLLDFYRALGRTQGVHFVPNGIDTEAFYTGTLSSHLNQAFSSLPRPIIGYMGTLNEDRMDLNLVEFLAKKNPHKSFVLAGPVWKGIAHQIERLTAQYPNIISISRVPYSEVASVIAKFDVCIFPHSGSAFIRYTHPMKFYEYLALGKPVISMASDGWESFAPHVTFAKSFEEFHAGIEYALGEESKDQCAARREFALSNTYAARVGEMLRIINL